MRLELLKELCETPGISGREARIRDVLKRELASVGAEVKTDAVGNVLGKLPGQGKGRLMIAAHIDEIGFYVNAIDDKGYLRVINVGGFDPRTLVAQRVLVQGKTRDLVGTMMPAGKPTHLQDEEDRKRAPKVSDLFIDLGLPKDQVTAEVEIGTPVSMHREMLQIGNNISCKALDDRLGAFVMLEALRQARSHAMDVIVVGTVQEECHMLVAPAAFGLEPDLALVLDVTLAGDIPGVDEQNRVTEVGKGAAIKVMDSGAISNPKLVEFLKRLAEERGIAHQMEILPRGGTDASGIQRVRAGVPVAGISMPLRYVHTTVETVSPSDVEACIALTAAFIEEAHNADCVL